MGDEGRSDEQRYIDESVRDPFLRRFALGALHVRRHQRLYALTGVWLVALALFPVVTSSGGDAQPVAVRSAPPAAEHTLSPTGAATPTGDEPAIETEALPEPALPSASPAPNLDPPPPPAPYPGGGEEPDGPRTAPAPPPPPPPSEEDPGAEEACEDPPDDDGDPLTDALEELTGPDDEQDEPDDCETAE